MSRACLAPLLVASIFMIATDAPSAGARGGMDSSTCASRTTRVDTGQIRWATSPEEDRSDLDEWCRGVGPPVYFPAAANIGGTSPPPLEDLVVVTWNVHLAEGRLDQLVGELRRGRFTGGRPVRHFVLLLQELYRRGAEVPTFTNEARSAFAIRPRDPLSPDARDQALGLGLSMLYVPSMRNGAELLEDRGNAILSTEPITAGLALELPFERQRRVAVGASLTVLNHGQPATLRLLDVHLEPLSSPKSLWVFRNPRKRQIAALLNLLTTAKYESDRTWAGTVLGGDFNTIQGGIEESAYRDARIWGQSSLREDPRSTHFLGRLDHLFFRLAPGWAASTTVIEEKFGSDHHPVLGQFTRVR
jgi:endonuclease/exonuclease/phosphatase family metal-dependent hydrolase